MGSRMRKNKSQRDQRRSQLSANLPRITVDTETGSVHMRHRVDMKTGMYRGKKVLEVNDSTEVQPVGDSGDDSAKSDKKDSNNKATKTK